MEATFSQRNGYVKVSDVLIRERITEEIQNSIINVYDKYCDWCTNNLRLGFSPSYLIAEEVWCHFFNYQVRNFSSLQAECVENFFEDQCHWYLKLDLLEFIIKVIPQIANRSLSRSLHFFEEAINREFQRLGFAYRIVNHLVVDIISDSEIHSIETAINETNDNVKEHLSAALSLLADRKEPNFRDSIKESISAVESICRDLTGESTLGQALKKLESNGIQINNQLKSAFDKLYAYTNQQDTGIRHALIEDDSVPEYDEALFMLVTCSAFINYLKSKKDKIS